MKKKILSLCVVMALAVTAIIGGTLAYFSDTDNQTNVFTTGTVKIDLWEDFGDNDDTGIEELKPVPVDENGNILSTAENLVVEKEIYVTNTGSEDAYVRLHIAIPVELEKINTYKAVDGVLHFSYESNAVAEKWDWSKSVDDDNYITKDNKYTAKIDNVEYTVYVVTYTTALKTNDDTVDAISTVWMDALTTQEDRDTINGKLGAEWKIHVAAEGTQAEGFDNAYEALNAAFGNPTDAAYTPTFDWNAVADGAIFVNKG